MKQNEYPSPAMAITRPIVVKIGTNVITTGDVLPDVASIRRLVTQVAKLHHAGQPVILVSSGAVGFGRATLPTDRHPVDDVAERQLYAATGQIRLMQHYAHLFDAEQVPIAQVLATKHDFQDAAHYRNMQRCFGTLLSHGVIPIVNENDPVSVSELMFTDNDELAGLVATLVDASHLILLTSVEGVFTRNPSDRSVQLVRSIEVDEDGSGLVETRGRSTGGRGGMASKLAVARRVARVGIDVSIAGGRLPAVLGQIVRGEPVGTLVRAAKHRSGPRRRLAFANDQAQATVTANAGAISRIRSGAASLLPVGITAVAGRCQRFDVVRIVDAAGGLIGIGRAEYGSSALRRLIGKQRQKPFVRSEYLVLYPA